MATKQQMLESKSRTQRRLNNVNMSKIRLFSKTKAGDHFHRIILSDDEVVKKFRMLNRHFLERVSGSEPPCGKTDHSPEITMLSNRRQMHFVCRTKRNSVNVAE